MAIRLQRSLLIGGLGVTMGLGLLEGLFKPFWEMGGWMAVGTVVLGAGWWLFQAPRRSHGESRTLTPPDLNGLQRVLADVETLLSVVQSEGVQSEGVQSEGQGSEGLTVSPGLRSLEAQVARWNETRVRLVNGHQRSDLRVMVLGSQGVGKTTLLQGLEKSWRRSGQHSDGIFESVSGQIPDRVSGGICLQEAIAPPLSTSNLQSGSLKTDNKTSENKTSENKTSGKNTSGDPAKDWTAVQEADLLLFLTVGDLTATELATLTHWVKAQHRVVVALNKVDQYLPLERGVVLNQLQQRLGDLLKPDDVVAIAAAPNPVKVRQHQADGSLLEHWEDPAPILTPLTQRLDTLLTHEAEHLRIATSWREAIALKQDLRDGVNQLRRTRALPKIEQMQWIAALSAFANPVPTLDLLATAVINAQLVLDVGQVYQQKFALEHAQQCARTLASLMVKLGLVELSSQLIGVTLKSHALTYVVGGVVQGTSAAYLTRVAGLSLIEYFQEMEIVPTEDAQTLSARPWQIERLGQALKSVFDQQQQAGLVQTLVAQTLSRLPLPTHSSEIFETSSQPLKDMAI